MLTSYDVSYISYLIRWKSNFVPANTFSYDSIFGEERHDFFERDGYFFSLRKLLKKYSGGHVFSLTFG